MKRNLVLTNAISNGGDFLIQKSGIMLAFENLGEENCIAKNIYDEGVLEEDIKECNNIIYIGGPGYSSRLIENYIYSIFLWAKKYKKKMFFLGCGWYGNSDCAEYIENFGFSDQAKEVLEYINGTGVLGCRDFLTQNVLGRSGFYNSLMTGCPVWYMNINNQTNMNAQLKKIVISDMGITKDSALNEKKLGQLKALLNYIKSRFEKIEILFTFNNGIDTIYSSEFNCQVVSVLKEIGIRYKDISNSSEGFGIYDDADFHVGYRLHSHLYCLSKGIPSVLVSEDARGLGTCETFGETKLYANISQNNIYIGNPNLIKEIDGEINRILQNKDCEMKRINKIILHHYNYDVKLFFDKVREG